MKGLSGKYVVAPKSTSKSIVINITTDPVKLKNVHSLGKLKADVLLRSSSSNHIWPYLEPFPLPHVPKLKPMSIIIGKNSPHPEQTRWHHTWVTKHNRSSSSGPWTATCRRLAKFTLQKFLFRVRSKLTYISVAGPSRVLVANNSTKNTLIRNWICMNECRNSIVYYFFCWSFVRGSLLESSQLKVGDELWSGRSHNWGIV